VGIEKPQSRLTSPHKYPLKLQQMNVGHRCGSMCAGSMCMCLCLSVSLLLWIREFLCICVSLKLCFADMCLFSDHLKGTTCADSWDIRQNMGQICLPLVLRLNWRPEVRLLVGIRFFRLAFYNGGVW